MTNDAIAPPALDRRKMLGAFAAVPLLAVPIAAPALPRSSDITAFNQAWATYREATARFQHFYATTLDPLSKLRPRDPSLAPYRVGTSMFTGEPLFERFLPKDLDERGDHAYSRNRGWLAAREHWQAYCAERDAFDARTGYLYLEKHGGDLVEAAAEARDAMLVMPAPDHAALLRKLSIMFDDDECPDLHEWDALREAIRADVERLALVTA